MAKRKDRFVVGKKRPGTLIWLRGNGGQITSTIPLTIEDAKALCDEQSETIFELVPYTPKKRGKKQ